MEFDFCFILAMWCGIIGLSNKSEVIMEVSMHIELFPLDKIKIDGVDISLGMKKDLVEKLIGLEIGRARVGKEC